MNAIPSKQGGWNKVKSKLIRSLSNRDNPGPKQRLISESVKSTLPEIPHDNGIHFEAKTNNIRTETSLPRRPSRFTVQTIPDVHETLSNKSTDE